MSETLRAKLAQLGAPQLITYADRLGGDLRGLLAALDGPFAGAFGGVHILPFFDPIDGSDAGFDPADHTAVDSRLGSWADVGAIGQKYTMMADLIVNHVSSDSPPFQDWLRNGSESVYDGMFLTKDVVFPDGASDADIAAIYRPRPGAPFTNYEVAGSTREVWTTFTSQQIDINVDHPAAWQYLMDILDQFAAANIKMVRLDAVGYAIKRPGTACFMLDETMTFMGVLGDECHRRGMEMLVEIHSHFEYQKEMAAKVDWVYDFALPPLVLHSLHSGDATALERWVRERPVNAVTVLDTHDGIGVVDVAPTAERPGLLEPAAIDALVESIHDNSGGTSKEATGAAASNVDLYQVNCTFHSALGGDDVKTLMARTIQMLLPGVPQVYYAGLLAELNDMELLRSTNVGRDINRPYYDADRLAAALERPVVRQLLQLLRWRLENTELFAGEFEVLDSADNELSLRYRSGDRQLVANIDMASLALSLTVDGRTISTIDEL